MEGEAKTPSTTSPVATAQSPPSQSTGSTSPMTIPSDAKEGEDKTNLIVNYIPLMLTEDSLRDLFRSFGNIMHCKIVKDKVTGNSLGYGFVKFETSDSARAAISTLNGYALEGKRLKVGIARPPTSHLQTNLYVSGLPLSYGKPELTALVAPFGKVLECRVLHDASTKQPRGVGFARLDSHDGALNAITALNSTQVPGSRLTIVCKFADQPNNLPKRLQPGALTNVYQQGGDGSYGRFNSMGRQGGNGFGPAGGMNSGGSLLGGFGGFPGIGSAPLLSHSSSPSSSAPFGSHPSSTTQGPLSQAFNLSLPGSSSLLSGSGATPSQSSAAAGVSTTNGATATATSPAVAAVGAGAAAVTSAVPSTTSAASGAASQTMAAGVAPPQGTYMNGTGAPGVYSGICLFVYHLPPTCNENVLAQLFSTHGQVLSAKVMKDLHTGLNKGYGFVNMATPEQAQTAISGLNGYRMGSKYLKVSHKTKADEKQFGMHTGAPMHHGHQGMHMGGPHGHMGMHHGGHHHHHQGYHHHQGAPGGAPASYSAAAAGGAAPGGFPTMQQAGAYNM